jgi:hypothetical protein
MREGRDRKQSTRIGGIMYTEGPWRVGDAGHTVFGPKKPDGSIPNRIADVRQSGDDARLIAAAPSLLQALSEVVAEWDERNRRYCAEHGPGYYPPEDTGGIMLARAAIAKAEGK